MSGIVGYTGKRNAQEIILSGLGKLEYRGYDSAGIAVIGPNGLKSAKFKGRLSVLTDYLSLNPLEGTTGIGHTRLATHGVPSNENAHPHLNEKKTIAVIHNGIIESYQELKRDLIEKGYRFRSQTDSEVVAHLFDWYYSGDLLEAAFKVESSIRGTYAILAVHRDRPGEIVALRRESPLIIGFGNDENLVVSDISAMLEHTRKAVFMENGEIADIYADRVSLYNTRHELVNREPTVIDWSLERATKGGYQHFMLKEIHEQPQGIRDTINTRLDGDGFIKFDDIKLTSEDIGRYERIRIVACGTAYHAGCVGKYVIEKLARMQVLCDVASEFRYADPFVDDRTLVIAVSQSGETADTLAALREAKRKGARILSITNVVGSSIARESDDVFYTWAGPEVAVASTKAYTTQLVAFYMLALNIALARSTITQRSYFEMIDQLIQTADLMDRLLEDDSEEREIAWAIKDSVSMFYLGRGVDLQSAREMALKLSEVSYIHAESFAGGEMKHGPIALIDTGMPVIALSTQSNMAEKMVSNIQEIKARGAYLIGIGIEGDRLLEEVCDKTLMLPKVDSLLTPLLAAVPGQLIAYHTAVRRGFDPDRPRNVGKSVTTE